MKKINTRKELIEFLKTRFEVSKTAEEHLNEKDFIEEELPYSNFMVLEDFNLDEGFYCKLYFLRNEDEDGFKEILADYFSDDDIDDVTGKPTRVLNWDAYLDNEIAVVDLDRKKVFRMTVKTTLVKEEVLKISSNQ